MHFVIAKADSKTPRLKSKVKNLSSAKKFYALTKKMRNAVELDFLAGIRKFKRRISSRALYDAWESGGYEKIETLLPWDKLDEDMQKVSDVLNSKMFEAMAIAMKITADTHPQSKLLRLDGQNPRLRNYVSHRIGLLRDDTTVDSRVHIREVIGRSFTQAATPRQIATEIKESIGLGKRYRSALKNYTRWVLYESGQKNIENQQKMISAYADRLLVSRAKAIARTETRMAANHAQRTVWREAAAQGLINRNTAKRTWVVDGAPCEDCEPMDGQQTSIDEPYTAPDDTPVEPGEMHTNCECIETLETQ